MAHKRERPYVVYPPGWPYMARARAFSTLEAAKKAARKIANETGQEVKVDYVSHGRLGRVNIDPIVIKPASHQERGDIAAFHRADAWDAAEQRVRALLTEAGGGDQ